MVIEHVSGKNKGTIMLYALSTCGWCAKTKELLRELGIEFDYTFVDLLEGKEQDDAMNTVELALLVAKVPAAIVVPPS